MGTSTTLSTFTACMFVIIIIIIIIIGNVSTVMMLHTLIYIYIYVCMEKSVNTYGSCFLLRSGVKPVILSTTLRVSACDFSNCFKYSCISATFE